MVYKEGTFKLPEPPPSHLWLRVCVHCIVLQPTQNESDNDQRQQNHHMFSKMSGLRGILVDIYIDVSRRHFWKSWVIHTTEKIQNFKTLTSLNWKWWVQDSSRWAARMSGPYMVYYFNMYCYNRVIFVC
jgi:hypothetical protein